MTDERSGARRAFLARPSEWSERLRRPGTITVVALVLIAAQVAFRTWAVAGSWFFSDDYLFLGDVGHSDDTFAWYFRYHFQHFMPLSFVLVKLGTLAGPFSWTSVVVITAALQLLASLACWWMLVSLFGRRWACLPLLVFYLLCPLTMPSVTWWAVTVNQLPHQAATFLTIGAHVRFLRTHRRRDLALVLLGLLIGYGTYTKAMLTPIVLVLLTLMYFTTGPLARRVTTTLPRDWKLWFVHAVVGGAYLLAYVLRAPSSAAAEVRPDALSFFHDMVLRTLVPALVGGPMEWAPWILPVTVANPSRHLMVLSAVVVAGVLGYGVARRDRAARALVLPLVYLGVSLAIAYVSRLYVIDLSGTWWVSGHMQYLADLTPVLVLAGGLMFLTTLGAAEPSAPRQPAVLLWEARPVLVAAGTIAFAVASLVTSVRYVEAWHADFPQRVFFQNAIDTVERERPTLPDSALPKEAVNGLLGRYTDPAVSLSPVREHFDVVDRGVDLRTFDSEGHLVPAEVDGPVVSRRPEAPCAYRGTGEATRIAVDPVLDVPLWVQVEYRALRPSHVAFVVGDRRVGAELRAGTHRLLFKAQGGWSSVELWTEADRPVCVSSISAGQLRAEEGAP